MRVLIVHPHFTIYGGAEILIAKLSKYLSKRNDISILTTQMSNEIKKDFNGIEIFEIREMREWLQNYYGLYDVINSHNHPCELLLYPKEKSHIWMMNEPPEIVLRGGSLPSNQRDIVRESVDKIVVVDRFNAERAKRIYGLEPVINHYGIDYDFFSKGNPNRIREEYNIDNKFIVVHTGWFNSFKNQEESVRVVSRLRQKIPEILLVLIGYNNCPYFSKVDRIIKKEKLQDHVLITGHLPRDKVRDFYHASNIALFPISTQGGWLSPFEAICSGLPIVISSDAPCSDIIREHTLGIVTKQYEKAILDLYNKPLKLEHASKWIKNNLTWNKYSRNMEEIFKELL